MEACVKAERAAIQRAHIEVHEREIVKDKRREKRVVVAKKRIFEAKDDRKKYARKLIML